jgi:hypothetical protein
MVDHDTTQLRVDAWNYGDLAAPRNAVLIALDGRFFSFAPEFDLAEIRQRALDT